MILGLTILIILMGGLVVGFHQGFISQFVQIIALFLAFIFAIYYFQTLSELIIQLTRKVLKISMDVQWIYIINILAFSLMFSVSYWIYLAIGSLLGSLTNLPIINFTNSLLGAMIGGLKRYLLIFFLLNILLATPITWFKQQYQEIPILQTIVKNTPILSKLTFDKFILQVKEGD